MPRRGRSFFPRDPFAIELEPMARNGSPLEGSRQRGRRWGDTRAASLSQSSSNVWSRSSSKGAMTPSLRASIRCERVSPPLRRLLVTPADHPRATGA
jgi:hypothetical protein